MYQKLKHNLILMYGFTSSIILTVVLTFILVMSVRQQMSNDQIQFERSAKSFMEQIQQKGSIGITWLRQLEVERQWCLKICENQVDIEIPNEYAYEGDLEKLFQGVYDKVKESDSTFFDIIQLNGMKSSDCVKLQGEDGNGYYGILYMLKTDEVRQTVTVLQVKRTLRESVFTYLGFLSICEFFGILLLFLLSYIYVGYVLRPVEEANQKQKEFIAAVSHELRSPLAVIRVGVDSMKHEIEYAENDAGLGQYLYPMEGECIRMNRLIEDMLLLAASDQKSWTIEKEEVDIETILIECYDAFCMMNQENQDKIAIDLSEDALPLILGDGQRIKQIVMILLDNAMSYTDPAKGISLRAYQKKKEVCIEVEDHGEGISDIEKKKIFESFYRRDSARKDRRHMGLGLSIAKRLVELHKGQIEVKDTLGGGTTFTVWFPIE